MVEQDSMEEKRREMERRINPSGTELARRIEAISEEPMGKDDCGKLKQRMLRYIELGTEFPQRGRIQRGLKQKYRRQLKAMVFFARKSGCVREEGRRELSRVAEQLVGELGDPAVFDVADRYERTIQRVFSETTAGGL